MRYEIHVYSGDCYCSKRSLMEVAVDWGELEDFNLFLVDTVTGAFRYLATKEVLYAVAERLLYLGELK